MIFIIALKYQILSDSTSLFAEVELSEKISEEIKKEIIGDEKNHVIPMPEFDDGALDLCEYGAAPGGDDDDDYQGGNYTSYHSYNTTNSSYNTEFKKNEFAFDINLKKKSSSDLSGVGNFFKSIGCSIKGLFSKKNQMVMEKMDLKMK